MKYILVLLMCLKLLFGDDNTPSILILNEYDSSIGDIELSEYFPSKNFIAGDDTSPFMSSLDSLKNPASGRMPLVRTMGEDFDVDGFGVVVDVCPIDADNDADDDGVCGDVDQCEGFDDNADTDFDGIADGCDICPNDAYDDADDDGI